TSKTSGYRNVRREPGAQMYRQPGLEKPYSSPGLSTRMLVRVAASGIHSAIRSTATAATSELALMAQRLFTMNYMPPPPRCRHLSSRRLLLFRADDRHQV